VRLAARLLVALALVGSAWLCIQGVAERPAEADEPAAQRVCVELRGSNANVCREAARNKLYGTSKIGIEHCFVGR
jgi:hypothetical protein